MASDSISRALDAAMEHHKAGRLPLAEQLYRGVLASRPGDALALHYYGLLCHHRGRSEEGADLIRRSLEISPRSSEAHANLGLIFMSEKMYAEAAQSFRQAVGYKRDNPVAHNNLGNALVELDELEEAVTAYREALRLAPHLAEAFHGLGVALRRLGDYQAAERAARDALALRPDYADAHNGLGAALMEQGDVNAAIACHRHALALRPEYTEALNNLGHALAVKGEAGEGTDTLRRACAIDPGYAEAHFHLALALLMSGNLEEGLVEYEWRRQKPGFPVHHFAQPEWAGEPLSGRTILLTVEQGLGDTLHFIRYASMLADRGARVVVQAQKPLVALVRTVPGVAEVVPDGSPLPEFDCHVPLLSLPLRMGTRMESLPGRVPYMHADPAAVASWGNRLEGLCGLKVGLVWAGGAHTRQYRHVDRRRSLALERFAFLGTIPGISLVSLQKGGPAEQVKTAPAELKILDLMDEVSDFADTAALIANLDLVISVDTSVAHLAGALAKPVWILSRFDGDWRWFVNREDSPWYPTARVFHQLEGGPWDPVLARLEEEARRVAAGERDRLSPFAS